MKFISEQVNRIKMNYKYERVWRRLYKEYCIILNPKDRSRVEKGLRRFFYAAIQDKTERITLENIAVSTMFIVNLNSIDEESYNRLKAMYVYEFANSFYKAWANHLIKCGDIEERTFQSNRDDEIINLLCSRDKLFRNYFESYSTAAKSYKIRVFLPRPSETWIRREKEHSVVIDIDHENNIELGFFNAGFDYAVIDNINQVGHLRGAFLSPKEDFESAIFSTLQIGNTSGKMIWSI